MLIHDFTRKIFEIIKNDLNIEGEELLQKSNLLQYINIKTKSANKGSKSRGSFANLYAIYVLTEDYIKVVYQDKKDYSKHTGAVFSELFERQRRLPFGAKLQNHALNHRLNEEYHKFFPTTEVQVILRDIPTSRYWINQKLMFVELKNNKVDISKTILSIINAYIKAKLSAFEVFISTCEELQEIGSKDKEKIFLFIKKLLEPNVDARLFEITSYSILKYYYYDKKIYWGYNKNKLIEEKLKLYKTGRTNANDGGIDFVMRPLGYFFQVTETLDIRKYFLDIDKLEHYPIRFVIKTTESEEYILEHLRNGAMEQYGIEKIILRYMNSIEEVINIKKLLQYFDEANEKGYLSDILNEILIQSKVEFNYNDEDDDNDDDF